MPSRYITSLLFFGGIVVLGIIFTQSYWLIKSWDLKDQEFDQTVHIALRQVAENIATYNNIELPKQNLIQRRSSNIYAVNVNSSIDANILEDNLLTLFEQYSIKTDFEYAVYDCYSDHLVYGNYCKIVADSKAQMKSTESLPKFDDLIYYFVVKFPSRESYLLSNIRISVIFSMITTLAVIFFLYTMWIIVKQKKLSELQKDFINNMTHEFKTPIASIKIATDVLSQSQAIKSEPKLKRYAEIINQQNSRLNDQVEKVLNIAKLEDEGFTLNREVFEPSLIIAEITRVEGDKLPLGTIKYTAPKTYTLLSADKIHFTNVIYNLLDNAIKYSKESGPHVEIILERENGHCRLKVIDNGIGIARENLKKIYEKFYRVSTGNIHNIKGFGLGLFYVKNICKAHGWELSIQSEPDIGTTVVIEMSAYENIIKEKRGVKKLDHQHI